jgi:coenzyme F420 hydrogenase subunit beta
VFIGKPCDIAALCKSQVVRRKLQNKVELVISIFCAGTPSTRQTYLLLDVLGVRPEEVEVLRYRGFGWPGATTVKLKGGDGQVRQMTYEQAWGAILSRGERLRCRLCPDSTGEMADISCGDAWHKRQNRDEAGWSIILVRTEKGKTIFHQAMEDGYVTATKAEPDAIMLEQKAHLRRKSRIWGTLGVMRAFGITTPRFSGFSLEENWAGLGGYEKFRTVAGTVKRIIARGTIERRENKADLKVKAKVQ